MNSLQDEYFVEQIDDHWVSLIFPIVFYVLGFFMSILILIFTLTIFLPEQWIAFSGFTFLFGFIVFSLANHWFFISLLHWELSSIVISNKRILIFEYFPYVKHDASYAVIDDINELEKRKHGFWKNVFDYGDLILHLSTSGDPIVLHFVPKPSRVLAIIEHARKKSMTF